MKIQLLLELIQTTQTSKPFHGSLVLRRDSKHYNRNVLRKELGAGTQSSVKDHPNDPHMVKKHNIRPYPDTLGKQTDGFNQFINYLIEHDLLDNVHFPKVYDIKEIVDQDDRKIYTYTMEKLVPSMSLYRDEIDAFCEKIFTPELAERFFTDASMLGRSEETYKYRMFDLFTQEFDEALNYGRITDIQDESLRDAFVTLHMISLRLKKSSDLHNGNFMWRRSSTGVQIVFTDPFH